MRKLFYVVLFFFFATDVFASSQVTTSQQQHELLQMARKGCQKPLGFFPTPSKIMCVLTAVGKTQNEVKPKAVAIIFSVCSGHSSQSLPAGTNPMKYPTLGACLSDSNAVNLINRELSAQGFPAVKVVNSGILTHHKPS